MEARSRVERSVEECCALDETALCRECLKLVDEYVRAIKQREAEAG